MKRILTLILLLVISQGRVYALGLGNIDLNSALNEPFDARIELLSTTAEDLESLKAGLADAEAFRRANIDRPFFLSRLKFSVRDSEDGPDYIRIHSSEPVREPFLNFLLEVSWSKGRLFREYTVLLDPPLYDPSKKMLEFSQSVAPVPESAIQGNKVVYADEFTRHTAGAQTSYSGGDYGLTQSQDTLWSIAKAMRPDDSITVNQMMLALLRTNPEAFIKNNINGLRRGQILHTPDANEINALTESEALAEVKSQYAMWGDEIRATVSETVTERPAVSIPAEILSETTPVEEATVTQEEVVSEAELRLVTPTGKGEGSDQVAVGEKGAETGATVSAEELVLAKESVESLTQENTELQDKLQESEVLIDDLKRLIALKDDELVSLQNQLAQAQAVEETKEVAPAEEAAEEVAPAEEAAEEIAPAEEAASETTDMQPPGTPSGLTGVVSQYLGPVKDIVAGNRMIAIAGGGILLVLILLGVFIKIRGRSATAPEAESITTEFPDFNEGEVDGLSITDSERITGIDESEAVTVIPESLEMAGIAADAEAKKMQLPGGAPAGEELEEDPMQEVNTYLAFEQFGQAEEFVRKALDSEPDNPEYHIKLLEVFYTSGNKKSYEEAARVLHNKLGGKGEHWSMAVAMWQEMSPGRALFEAPVEGEERETGSSITRGGIVDLTADDEAAGDAGLDFDLGSAAGRAGGKSEDDILDITAAVDTSSDDLLDVTAAVGLVEDEAAESRTDAEEMFDITTGDEEGGMLDITTSAEEGGMLDITAGAEEEDMLDLTVGAEEAAGMELMVDRNEGKLLDLTVSEDILDVSKEKRSGVDLLDVTSSMTSSASSALELDSDEDLLDVTAATSAGADSDELLEIDFEREVNAASGVKDDNVIDFDVGALEMESDQAETIESDVNNVIEFDITASGAGEGGDDEGLELSLGAAGDDLGEKDGGIELDLSDISGESDDSGNEFSLSLDIEGDATVQADIDSMFDIAGPGEGNADDEIDMNMTMEMKKSSVGMSMDNGEMEGNEVPEIDLTLDDEGTGTGEDEIDIEGTVEIPKFDLDMDDDIEGDARTVFVPRSMQPEEQSDEEEITTKLDLAKAYIELGDKDSAKIILAEVMAEGNTDQRQQAQELLGQI